MLSYRVCVVCDSQDIKVAFSIPSHNNNSVLTIWRFQYSFLIIWSPFLFPWFLFCFQLTSPILSHEYGAKALYSIRRIFFCFVDQSQQDISWAAVLPPVCFHNASCGELAYDEAFELQLTMPIIDMRSVYGQYNTNKIVKLLQC